MYFSTTCIFVSLLIPSTLSHPLKAPFSHISTSGLEPRSTHSRNCPPPTFQPFQVQFFQTFTSIVDTSSDYRTSPFSTISALQFRLLSTNNSLSTECTRFLHPAEISAGERLDDDNYWQPCDENSASFSWDGKMITVLLEWSCSGELGVAGGHITIPTTCYTTDTSFQLGQGTLCESSTASLTGVYTNNWNQKDGWWSYEVDGKGQPVGGVVLPAPTFY